MLLGRRLQRLPDLGLNQDRLHEQFQPWLLTMAENDCQQAARSLAGRRSPFSSPTGQTTALDNPADFDSEADAARDVFLDLNAAMERLSDRQRNVAELFVKGHSVAEIAGQLRLTYRQANYALQQAIKRLRNWLS